MYTIDDVMSRLTEWRDLPSYQLERRVDIFFSLYLSEALQKHFGMPFSEIVIPEFPVHQRLTKAVPPKGAYSDKIDYVVPAADKSVVVFVELKTDMESRRVCQDAIMGSVEKCSFEEILAGLVDIARKTKKREKYGYLLDLLKATGYLKIPPGLGKRGWLQALGEVEITAPEIRIETAYVQPNREKDSDQNVIDFKTFASIVNQHSDEVSTAFAKALKAWIKPPGLD